MKYELFKNNKGEYWFVKRYKLYYLNEFEVWGLDTSIWYDKIDYIKYKVKFSLENGKKYIHLKKIGEI